MARMRFGVSLRLEDAATKMIGDSLKGVKSHSAKRDILTPWKEQDRRNREVYTGSGVADASLRKGMFRRSANLRYPHLNARDVPSPPRISTRSEGAQRGTGKPASMSLEQFLGQD